jgi:hypothetical protein
MMTDGVDRRGLGEVPALFVEPYKPRQLWISRQNSLEENTGSRISYM